jgi:hypothetical protein
MPTDELDEPNDSSANVQNDVEDTFRKKRRKMTVKGIDPANLFSAPEVQLSVIHDQLKKELKPQSVIEKMYVEDLSHVVWETRKLRENKRSILRYEMQPASKAIIEHVLAETYPLDKASRDSLAQKLAAGLYETKKNQAEVARN